MNETQSVYRILDANVNRLREALRVVEEYFRFAREDENASVALKKMRHSIVDMENEIGNTALLNGRDTAADCFASSTRAEELNRSNVSDVLTANFKRAQEACRVIEEYAKAISAITASKIAKELRFALYALQKDHGIDL